MIRPAFYLKRNLVRNANKARRYPIADRMVVLKSRPYVMKFEETFYSIAKKLFGENQQHYWTILSDINEIRYPDEWEAGDIIQIPEIIVQESFNRE